jgi:SWIM zinc finger
MDKRTAVFDQEARVARALREVLADYAFTPHDGSLICEGPSGAYLVDPVTGTCTCEDWLRRASQCGGACKHVVAARHLALEQGRDLEQEAAARQWAVLRAELAAEREAVNRRLDAEFERIFG